MENASKALLIAGAILIAILLISVGIMVLQSANGIVDEAGSNMKAQEIEAFNKQFDSYIGDQKGSSVRTLMGKVKSSNATHEDNQVKVKFNGKEMLADEVSSHTRPTATYDVEIVSANSGIITTITVTGPDAKPSAGPVE